MKKIIGLLMLLVAFMACEKAFSIVDQIVFLNCFCSY